MLVVADIETEGLDNPTKIWVLCAKEIDTGVTHVFRNLHDNQADKERFQAFAGTVTGWVGHNFMGFDKPCITRITGVDLPYRQVVDTLVVSRLLNSWSESDHSLAAWGERLGVPKIYFKDFSGWSQEMEDYCLQDLEVTLSLYYRFKPYLFSSQWRESLRLEHDISYISYEMHKNGFGFNQPLALSLQKEILERLTTIDTELRQAFPPRSRLIREVTPRATKFGTLSRVDFRWTDETDLSAYGVGHPFSRIEFEPFNPGSPKQIVERLNEAGWKPTEKTKGHTKAEREKDESKLEAYRVSGWSISENNLATLPKTAPEAAKKLVQRLLLDSRRSTLEEWLKAFSDHDKRIHGSFRHIGAWTHRMSHASPNMANIPAGKSEYADAMRSLWCVPTDRLLVGVDADGIQLRILAHYLNSERFTQALIHGNKEDGTDAHSMNQKALGAVCKDRDTAKTFIYAWLLGAGTPKIAEILECNQKAARVASRNFVESIPELKRLKEEVIPRDAAMGYFEGLDGRLVMCDNEHLMLAGYLQNGESVVMKRANVLWRSRLLKEKIPFKQVNFVHDEWQTEVPNDLELAKYVANVQADSITQVGIDLKLNCPLAGSILNSHKQLAIGTHWGLTH